MIKKIISLSIITVLIFFLYSFDFLLVPQFAVAQTTGAASIMAIVATPVSPVSETISGQIHEFASSTSFVIKANPMIGSPVSVTTDVGFDLGAAFEATLDGLSPSTSYTCTITSLPDNTVIADSSTCPNFVTLAPGTPDSVTGLQAVPVSSTSEDITGQISTAASSTSLVVNATPMMGSAVSASITLPQPTPESFAFMIPLSGLSPNTSYTCNITSLPDNTIIADSSACPNFVTNSSGTTASSSAFSISNFSASTNSGGTMIAFSATANGVATSSDFDYSFLCSTSATTLGGSGQPTSSYTIPMASVTNPLSLVNSISLTNPVTSSTPYYCEIFDTNGNALSSIVTVSLASGQPNIPYSTNITDTGATIQINVVPSTANTPYIVYGNSATALTSAQISMTSSGIESFSGTISGLNPNTTYYYQVYDGNPDLAVPYNEDALSFTTTGSSSGTTTGSSTTLQTISGSITPLNTSQYSGAIVTCGTSPGNSDTTNRCDFQHLMAMINKLIGILVFIIAPAIAAICMAWGGFLYMTSAGGEGAKKGKAFIIDAFVGWLLAFAAFIIIKFILVQLGYNVAGGFLSFY